jgi:formylglycine-generating enzyme required for sulfatase activity
MMKKIILMVISVVFFLGLLCFTPELDAQSTPKTITHAKDNSVMVLIPGGTFQMGATGWHGDSIPVHSVALDSFYLDKFEVTNRQYLVFVKATGHRSPAHANDPSFDFWQKTSFPEEIADQPVVNVSWDDAAAYAKWAGKRLPTEAEWEYAARGLTNRKYPWGDQSPEDVKVAHSLIWNGKKNYFPVGSAALSTSPFGVMDLAGNVAEWVFDFYNPLYYSMQKDGQRNPQGPEQGFLRVVRGGSSQDASFYFRCTFRDVTIPQDRSSKVGFRCAKSP